MKLIFGIEGKILGDGDCSGRIERNTACSRITAIDDERSRRHETAAWTTV